MAEEKNIHTEEPEAKVINGTAVVEKQKFGKKVVNFLFSDKLDSVANYLTYYILGPNLKDLVYKLITGATQMALYGGQGGNTPPIGFNSGYNGARIDPMAYNMMSNMSPPPGYAQPQPGIYQQRVTLNDISFDTKDDAWLVLDRMNREIMRYGKVRVADFYTYAGITGQEGNWTLQGNGWYSLQGVMPIMRTDGRWIIDFPPVQSLR